MNRHTPPEDERTLEAVYREHGHRLWRALVLSTGQVEIASDAVAEAFAQALRRGDGIRDPLAWVWKAAFRIAAGEMKARAFMRTLPDEVAEEIPGSFVDLWRALALLTPHQRTAVVLADYAGYPHRQVAEVMGSTTAAVGVHVHRARTRLRKLLEENDDD